jgi:hypothetical protein
MWLLSEKGVTDACFYNGDKMNANRGSNVKITKL